MVLASIAPSSRINAIRLPNPQTFGNPRFKPAETCSKYSRRDPQSGEPITVRNLDNTSVKAVIAHIAREQSAGLKRRVFTVQADEVEA